ncbi:MAG: hypothetical protein WEC73_05650 [Chthoniobacterales bacterium]
MSSIALRTAIHTLFSFTSRQRVSEQCVKLSESYEKLFDGITKEAGMLRVEVPRMRGVDEDMRNWSFFEVLEHNAMVNRSITATVCQLAGGIPLSGSATIDTKKGVMPTGFADEGILPTFLDSIAAHNGEVEKLGRLRGTVKSQHPVFGPFDAHQWNCMFAFHLGLHLPQAEFVAKAAKSEQG